MLNSSIVDWNKEDDKQLLNEQIKEENTIIKSGIKDDFVKDAEAHPQKYIKFYKEHGLRSFAREEEPTDLGNPPRIELFDIINPAIFEGLKRESGWFQQLFAGGNRYVSKRRTFLASQRRRMKKCLPLNIYYMLYCPQLLLPEDIVKILRGDDLELVEGDPHIYRHILLQFVDEDQNFKYRPGVSYAASFKEVVSYHRNRWDRIFSAITLELHRAISKQEIDLSLSLFDDIPSYMILVLLGSCNIGRHIDRLMGKEREIFEFCPPLVMKTADILITHFYFSLLFHLKCEEELNVTMRKIGLIILINTAFRLLRETTGEDNRGGVLKDFLQETFVPLYQSVMKGMGERYIEFLEKIIELFEKKQGSELETLIRLYDGNRDKVYLKLMEDRFSDKFKNYFFTVIY